MAGGAVHWNSKRQPSVALSTAEAEYMALSVIAQHTIWLPRLLPELLISSFTSNSSILLPTIIKGDNQGSIFMTQNPSDHKRTKHIDIQHHFVRERVETKEIEVIWIPDSVQIWV